MPTFLNWPKTQTVKRALNLEEVRINQGALGHRTRKPTMLLSNVPEVVSLRRSRNVSPGEPWPETLQERLSMSSKLAEWAPGLVLVLVQAGRRINKGQTAQALRAMSFYGQGILNRATFRFARIGRSTWRVWVGTDLASDQLPRRLIPSPLTSQAHSRRELIKRCEGPNTFWWQW